MRRVIAELFFVFCYMLFAVCGFLVLVLLSAWAFAASEYFITRVFP